MSSEIVRIQQAEPFLDDSLSGLQSARCVTALNYFGQAGVPVASSTPKRCSDFRTKAMSNSILFLFCLWLIVHGGGRIIDALGLGGDTP